MRLSTAATGTGCALVLFAAGASPAATHRVPSEYATINLALGASSFGDTVLVAPGIYSDWDTMGGSSSAAFLVDGVVLRSEAGSASTILDMQGQSGSFFSVVRAVDLASDATRVEGFTIRGVVQGAPAIVVVDCGRVSVVDCRVEDVGSAVPGTGPSALRSRYSDIEVVNCSFMNCSAVAGGAIGQLVGDVVISGCEFIGCSSSAVYLDGNPDPSHSAQISGCSFVGNQSTFGGAAILSSYYAGGFTIADCRFEGNASTAGSGGAVRLNDFTRPITITASVFAHNYLTGAGTGGTLKIAIVSGDVSISQNTFFGSESANPFGGGTIDLVGGMDVDFSNNVIAASSSGQAAVVTQDVNMTSSCNVFWDNENADTEGFSLGKTDRIVDPAFCDPDTGDLTVSSESPCLPAHSLGCGLIGALGPGCGVVSIAPQSWGFIKSMYR